MNIKDNILSINKTDLDHILGSYYKNKNVPPSKIFLKNLKEELEFNGLSLEKLKTIRLEL